MAEQPASEFKKTVQRLVKPYRTLPYLEQKRVSFEMSEETDMIGPQLRQGFNSHKGREVDKMLFARDGAIRNTGNVIQYDKAL